MVDRPVSKTGEGKPHESSTLSPSTNVTTRSEFILSESLHFMIKIVLFDTDGVVIKKDKVFSVRFSEKLNIPIERILPFFKKEFQFCLIGQFDLKEAILKYLPTWGYKGTMDDLLSFWFDGESTINKEVIVAIQNLRKGGIKCFLHTNNEKYRTEYIWKKLNLEKHFDGIFSSSDLGCKKPNNIFWDTLYSKLKRPNKSEVLVLDDDKENVESAGNFGFNANLFENLESLSPFFPSP